MHNKRPCGDYYIMRKIKEGYVSDSDVAEVLKTASELKPGSSGFLGLGKKPGITFDNLKDRWIENGRGDDSRDIISVLKSFGYSRKEMNKVFRTVFDTRYGKYDTGNSPAVVEIAKYAKENDYTADLIKFMKDEFGFDENTLTEGKIKISDIRSIFEKIIHEPRTSEVDLRREFEKSNLGRHRK